MADHTQLLPVADMVRGLVRAAEFKEQDEKGRLWDDACRLALEAARVRGWGKDKVGVLTEFVPKRTLIAAVSYIERGDGRVLCVWNKRYGGWSLPGGMTEEGESPAVAQRRELMEETSLTTISADPVYEGQHGIEVDPSRASYVHIYRVAPAGKPRETEIGCPVTWLTRDEFLKWSPFAPFYAKVFDAVPAGMPTV